MPSGPISDGRLQMRMLALQSLPTRCYTTGLIATSLQANCTQKFLTVRGFFSVSLEGKFLDITRTVLVDPVGEIRSVDLLAPPA